MWQAKEKGWVYEVDTVKYCEWQHQEMECPLPWYPGETVDAQGVASQTNQTDQYLDVIIMDVVCTLKIMDLAVFLEDFLKGQKSPNTRTTFVKLF